MKKIENLVHIPEYIVQEAWKEMQYDDNSGFGVVLKAAGEYKAANLTPFFVLDKDSMQIYCFCQETFGKKLH